LRRRYHLPGAPFGKTRVRRTGFEVAWAEKKGHKKHKKPQKRQKKEGT
jgi:hypothetical protein